MHKWCPGWWLPLGQASGNSEPGNGKEHQQWSYLYLQDGLQGHVCYIVPCKSNACKQEPSLQGNWWPFLPYVYYYLVVTMHPDLLTWPLVTLSIYSRGYGKQLLSGVVPV